MNDLQKFLETQIPIAKALGIKVLKADDESAVVSAPLEVNRNHLGTAFGGSLASVLIFSGYTWIYRFMESRGFNVRVLLRKTEVDYPGPVETDLVATALAPDASEVAKFLESFNKKGVARISILAEIRSGDRVSCAMTGVFVAQKT